MTTNILSLPLLGSTVETGTNEDWLDSWFFGIAGSALAYPAAGNTGTGALGAITVGAGTPLGNSILKIVALTPVVTFTVTDDDGNMLGAGSAGVPFTQAGFNFTFTAGGSPAVGDAFTIAVAPKPLDISGIFFSLTIKRAPSRSGQPILEIDTNDVGSAVLINGGVTGIVSTSVAKEIILQRCPPGTYVFDIVGVAGSTRRVVSGTLNVVDGCSYTFA